MAIMHKYSTVCKFSNNYSLMGGIATQASINCSKENLTAFISKPTQTILNPNMDFPSTDYFDTIKLLQL